ncbi:MAG TPA: alpha/beta hydrolase-fold protein [Acidobacteriaceae bacterium]|nr:alpha/beta hydrolase-fold protein [Acidobacteriaceae bacterium]
MSRFPNTVLSEPLNGTGVRLLTIDSPALKRRADVTVYVPEGHERERLPLLILLHEVYGSHWNWWALGKVPETARAMLDAGTMRPFAIAMPSDGLWGGGTGYVPHRDFDAEAWIMDDVPACLGELLPQVKTDRFCLAGLSMGGYGALRLGMKYPARVRGIAAHSAVTRLEDIAAFASEPLEDYRSSGRENTEIAHWAKTNRALLPPIRFDCGREDSLIEGNRALHAMLLELGIPHIFEEHEGGHTWEYWQTHVRSTLEFVSAIEAGAPPIS